jgi:hypothetical protein
MIPLIYSKMLKRKIAQNDLSQISQISQIYPQIVIFYSARSVGTNSPVKQTALNLRNLRKSASKKAALK